jgi:DNA-binding Lrp family transcriptional regulator
MGSEYMNLSEKEKNIIMSLAKGPKTEYELFEKEKVASSSTVWKTVNKLKKLGLIEIERQETFPKIPNKLKKYYGLTFRGLVLALKLGVRLNQIQNWQELITSWIQNANILDSLIKVKEKFKIKADFQKIQNELIEYIKQNQEQIETFLKHYDLDFSDDILICIELHSFAAYMKTGIKILNRKERREVEKMIKDFPEHYKMMFFIPELWQSSLEGVRP